MSKKKSLGHNPLAYSTRRHASFDFITPSDEKQDKEEHDQNFTKVSKTTASYYLEEPVVDGIKDIADNRETSYSSIVNAILKSAIKKLNNR
ncbi:MAG: hypothetical protein CL670_11035 [Balneola sp.]|jgi:predicted DNA-binding ribbon-helix-helix protein|nr:hypothetical protein [Balneola sp.]MBE79680.1 hypothetical protein [Balneola sp.]|tara:strand:- start:1922 stop:2194 length:273 start_codon:yes stop_codon:yes gene_type:complete